jgi:hypothetical protein
MRGVEVSYNGVTDSRGCASYLRAKPGESINGPNDGLSRMIVF